MSVEVARHCRQRSEYGFNAVNNTLVKTTARKDARTTELRVQPSSSRLCTSHRGSTHARRGCSAGWFGRGWRSWARRARQAATEEREMATAEGAGSKVFAIGGLRSNGRGVEASRGCQIYK